MPGNYQLVYDVSMPVSDTSAFALLRTFGVLEFTLKARPGFLAASGNPSVNQRVKAKVDWPALDRAVVALHPADFLDRLSVPTRAKPLGGARNRPQVQFVQVATDGIWSAQFKESPLPNNDAEALVVAMRRVRNNLFHGGKEDPLQEQFPGDDEEWTVAALEVADLLMDLLDRWVLNP